jgi:hypothetical protein
MEYLKKKVIDMHFSPAHFCTSARAEAKGAARFAVKNIKALPPSILFEPFDMYICMV